MYNLLKGTSEKKEVEIWPSNFENKEIFTKEEKELMREAKKIFYDGIFVAGVNPVGKGKMNRISYYLSQKFGLTIFSVLSVEKDRLIEALDMFLEINKELEEKILFRLLDSSALIKKENNQKSININLKHYILFQNINYNSLKMKEKNKLKEYSDKVLFKNFIDINGVSLVERFKKSTTISDIQEKAIIERLSPEYAIILNEKENLKEITTNNIETNINNISLNINGDELEYKTFALDKEQVNLTNDISYGHRLILANPGAGKSVILLAKAFRMCKIYEEEKILVTCFNNNLSQSYRFRSACSGFKESDNLYISTFHKVVLDIVKDLLKKRYTINEFDKALDDLENAIDSKKIQLRFKAIFIDEVQIFEPRWLDICYKLLQEGEDSIFLMAGDINQDLKNMSKKGKAVWQLAKEIPSNFRGRVRYISKNYRNKKEICDYINNQLKYMNEKISEVEMVSLKDFEVVTSGESNSIGGRVERHLNNKRFDFKKNFKTQILEMIHDRKIDPSEIAVIIPYKQHSSFKYYPLSWVKSALDEEGIQYRIICGDTGGTSKHINGEGVIITTIDSALGLDFNTVILTGLYPLQYAIKDKSFYKVKSWTELKGKEDSDKEIYFNNLRKVYTACSRARENLYILSDLDSNTPINDFIKMEM